MDLVQIYHCFCDRTRLRILNLLCEGPLCVCHFQELLNEPQVKVSKHLSYLKTHGLVESTREANWVIYSLPQQIPAQLKSNLACLQDCVREDPVFRRDTAKARAVRPELSKTSPVGTTPRIRSARRG